MKRVGLITLAVLGISLIAKAEFKKTRDPNTGRLYCSEYAPNGRYLGDVHPINCERPQQQERGSSYAWEYNRYYDQYVCVVKDSRGFVIRELETDVCVRSLGVRYKWAFNRHYQQYVCVMTTPGGGIITEVDEGVCRSRGVGRPGTQQPPRPSDPRTPQPPVVTEPPRTERPASGSRAQAASEYAVVVYINKAATGPFAQTIIVKHGGRIIFQEKVSTGREQNEKPPSGRNYFSATPTGFFTPQTLSRDHKSKLWDADMPYAIFFNGGIAIHQVPDYAVNKLGTRASGGCIRAPEHVASRLFEIVEREGKGLVPVFNRDGSLSKSRQIRHKTLIVVEDSSSSNPPIYSSLF